MPRNKHAAVLVRRRKAGTLAEVQRTLWTAVVEAEAVLLAAAARHDEEVTLKAVHAVVQSTGAYAKLLEATAVEARLAAIEAQMQGRAA